MKNILVVSPQGMARTILGMKLALIKRDANLVITDNFRQARTVLAKGTFQILIIEFPITDSIEQFIAESMNKHTIDGGCSLDVVILSSLLLPGVLRSGVRQFAMPEENEKFKEYLKVALE